MGRKRDRQGRWLRTRHLVLVAGAAFCVFAGSLGADFTYDDHKVVLADTNLDAYRPALLLEYWYGRPLRQLTLAIDRSLFGRDPFGHHLHSVLWHVGCSLLVYLLVLRLSASRSAALLGALVFAVHPAHVEAVANVSNRKEALSLAFSLIALLAWMRVTDRPDRRRAWAAVGAVALGFALLAKKVAVAMLPIALAWEWLFVPPEKRILLRNPRVTVAAVAGLALLTIGVVLQRLDLADLAASRTLRGYAGEFSAGNVMLTSARAFWRYVELLLWPAGLCPDHRVVLSTTLASPPTLVAWWGLGGVMIAVFALRRRAPLLAFAGIWFLTTWLPISNLLPSAYILADRYLYAPSVALSIGCASLWLAIRVRTRGRPFATRARQLVAAACVVGLAATTLWHTQFWRNDDALWARTLRCNPQSFLAWNNLGLRLEARERHAESLPYFERAAELGFGAARHNRAEALLAMQRHEEAVAEYSRALAFDPGLVAAVRGRAQAYYELGRFAEAEADYDRLIAAHPGLAEPWNLRGAARVARGRHRAAERDFARAVELDPGHLMARYNLGITKLRLGDVDGAVSALRAAASLGFVDAEQALERISEARRGSAGPTGSS